MSSTYIDVRFSCYNQPYVHIILSNIFFHPFQSVSISLSISLHMFMCAFGRNKFIIIIIIIIIINTATSLPQHKNCSLSSYDCTLKRPRKLTNTLRSEIKALLQARSQTFTKAGVDIRGPLLSRLEGPRQATVLVEPVNPTTSCKYSQSEVRERNIQNLYTSFDNEDDFYWQYKLRLCGKIVSLLAELVRWWNGSCELLARFHNEHITVLFDQNATLYVVRW